MWSGWPVLSRCFSMSRVYNSLGELYPIFKGLLKAQELKASSWFLPAAVPNTQPLYKLLADAAGVTLLGTVSKRTSNFFHLKITNRHFLLSRSVFGAKTHKSGCWDRCFVLGGVFFGVVFSFSVLFLSFHRQTSLLSSHLCVCDCSTTSHKRT